LASPDDWQISCRLLSAGIGTIVSGGARKISQAPKKSAASRGVVSARHQGRTQFH
jgi:hypothetical protein